MKRNLWRRPATAARLRSVRRRRPIHKRILLHPITIFALLCMGVFLAGATWHSVAATIDVKAKVSAHLLTQPATIASPRDGTTITSSPFTVIGSCPDSSYVTLTRNGTFSGVASCINQQFSITTDLLIGTNQLLVQDFNLTDDPGPSGTAITVVYTPLIPANLVVQTQSTTNPVFPLRLTTTYTYQVQLVRHPFTWTISISGGTVPYSLAIQWGDKAPAQQSVASSQSVSLSHTYSTPGVHTIAITATDSTHQQALLQLVAIVLQTNAPTISSRTSPTSSNLWLVVALPAYGTVLLMTVSFWLGEKEAYRFVWPHKRPPQRHRS